MFWSSGTLLKCNRIAFAHTIFVQQILVIVRLTNKTKLTDALSAEITTYLPCKSEMSALVSEWVNKDWILLYADSQSLQIWVFTKDLIYLTNAGGESTTMLLSFCLSSSIILYPIVNGLDIVFALKWIRFTERCKGKKELVLLVCQTHISGTIPVHHTLAHLFICKPSSDNRITEQCVYLNFHDLFV